MKVFKQVQLSSIEAIKDWADQPFPGRMRLIYKNYNDAVKLSINKQAGG